VDSYFGNGFFYVNFFRKRFHFVNEDKYFFAFLVQACKAGVMAESGGEVYGL